MWVNVKNVESLVG